MRLRRSTRSRCSRYPFFMLAGSLMSYGGISKRLVCLAEAMVGAVQGGLAMVTVTACMFFAAISGSGPATVSAIGSFMIPAMNEKKYDHDFAAALTAAAGSIGVIIPPSIPFVIYGVVSGVSVGELFIAGIIPGIIIGFSLMALSSRVAKKRGYPISHNRMPVSQALREAFVGASRAGDYSRRHILRHIYAYRGGGLRFRLRHHHREICL